MHNRPNQEQQEQIDWLERPHFEEPLTADDLLEPYDDEEGWPHG